MADIVKGVGEDVGKLMGKFTKAYIVALVNSKLEDIMDGCVDAIIPDGLEAMMSGDVDNGDIVEKKDEDDAEVDDEKSLIPFVSGCCVISYKTGRGPDHVDHRYYDIACWSLSPQNSQIIKQCQRHTQLLGFTKKLKKAVKNMPSETFPAKKLTTKRTPQFYTERMKLIHNYFEKVTMSSAVTESDVFLEFFNLKYDSNKAYLTGIFFDALQSMSETEGINWNYALWRAERIGLDLSQVEMLKVVAIEKLGKAASQKLRSMAIPGYVPAKLKPKFISKFEGKLYGIIGTTVEAGWSTTEVAFNKVAEALNAALDKGVDPIKEILGKALDPLTKIVQEKFSDLQSAMTVSNDDLCDKNFDFIARIGPLNKCMTDIKNKNGKISDILKSLLSSVDDMNNCHKYVSYIQYNLGDPDGLLKYIPFLNDLRDNHYRLTIALSDCAYILLRSTVRAFIPIAKYLDEACNSFDAGTHIEKLKSAVREGGRKLAIDYFSLPSTLRRSTWYCGRSTENMIILLAEQSINAIANLIAQFAVNWKPTSSDDVVSSFIEALQIPLNKFLNDRIGEWLRVTRRSMQDMIANKFFDTIGSVVSSLCDSLDDLCKKLPPPLSDYLKPGAFIKYLFNKLVMNAIVFGVKKLAGSTEKSIYASADAEPPAPMDESNCRRLRWAPRIRNDEISFDAEKDENNEDNENTDNDNKKGDDDKKTDE